MLNDVVSDDLHIQHGLARRLLSFVVPLCVAVAISLMLLYYVYDRPYQAAHEVEAWAPLWSGIHAVERVARLSYVYTSGHATLEFPETGQGRYIVEMHIGGPAGVVPVPARVRVDGSEADLGPVDQLRTYHLLLDHAGNKLQIGIISRAAPVPPDPRAIGVLLAHVAVRALGPTTPPPLAIVGSGVVLAMFWLALVQLPGRIVWKTAALVLIGGLYGSSFALSRGRIAMQPVWLVLGGAAAMGMWVSRSEALPVMTSRAGSILFVVLWRVSLWLVGGIGLWHSRNVYWYGWGNAYNAGLTLDDRSAMLWRAVVSAWMQWDTVHYVAIAREGYRFLDVRWPTIAFFPLYPLLVRSVLPLVNNSDAVAALLISHLALFAAVLMLHALLVRDCGRVVAYRALVLLLLFPTSFFFVAGYTESLALALTIAGVWALREERWWLAGVSGALLALTRVPGVLFGIVIAATYLQQRRWRWRTIRWPMLSAGLPPLGLGLFMIYQWRSFGTPFAFLIAQESWDNGGAPPWVMPLGLVRDIRVSPEWEIASFQLVVWATFLGLAGLALLRLPLAYGLTGLLLLPAYLAHQPMSLVRHVLIAFPAFVVLAQITHRLWLRWVILSLMLACLVILTLFFVNGFFLA